MNKIILTATTAAVVFAAVASAHEGAEGVVRERMEGMSAMQDVIRTLTPMMRGETEYHADVVTAGAATLEAHAGETMTQLFPESWDDDAYYARSEIWEDCDRFVELAAQLEIWAVGLAEASSNPPGSPMAGTDGTSMMGGGDMMGGGSMMGGGTSMMAGGGASSPDAAMLADMPVDRVFNMVAQSCSACHTSFRAEQD